MIEKRGFTLVELLVVIAIIGIMAATGLVTITGARGKARDAQRKHDLAAFRTALELYHDDNNDRYPGTFTLTSNGSTVIYASATCLASTGVTTAKNNCLVPFYMTWMPRPPLIGEVYTFISSNTTARQDYRLYTTLEIQTYGSTFWVGQSGANITSGSVSCSVGSCLPL